MNRFQVKENFRNQFHHIRFSCPIQTGKTNRINLIPVGITFKIDLKGRFKSSECSIYLNPDYFHKLLSNTIYWMLFRSVNAENVLETDWPYPPDNTFAAIQAFYPAQ